MNKLKKLSIKLSISFAFLSCLVIANKANAMHEEILAFAKNNKIEIWNLANSSHPKYISTLQHFSNSNLILANCVSSILFSPIDKNRLISGTNDGEIKIWDLSKELDLYDEDENLIRTLNYYDGTGIKAIACSHLNKNIFASIGWSKEIKIWDLSKQKNLENTKTLTDNSEITSISFSPSIEENKNILVSISENGIIKIWDLGKRNGEECIKNFKTLCSCNTTIVFNPINKNILSCASSNGCISILDFSKKEHDQGFLTGGRLESSNRFFSCLAFNPIDKNMLIAATQLGKIYIFDLSKLQTNGQISPIDYNFPGSKIKSLAFSQTNKNILLVSLSKQQEQSSCDLIIIFDLPEKIFDHSKPKELITLKVLKGNGPIAFAPNFARKEQTKAQQEFKEKLEKARKLSTTKPASPDLEINW